MTQKFTINNATTFTQISNLMQGQKDKEIRGSTNNNVQQIYVHGLKLHGITPSDKHARAQKEAQGAAWIQNAINTQYPNNPSLGQRVFQHVQATQGINLTARVFKHDLATIDQSITELRQKDTVATNLITLNSAGQLTPAKAVALLSIARDVHVAANLRDQAATALHNNMMALNATGRYQVLASSDDLTGALFTLRLSNGTPAFPVADLTTITQDEFTRSIGQQSGDSFYRGDCLAGRLLKHGMDRLGNGVLPGLATTMRNSIQTQIQASNNVPPTVKPPGEQQQVYNPAFVNVVLTQADTILGTQANSGLPQELTTFLTGISTTITNLVNNSAVPLINPQTHQSWNGTDLLRTNVILRCIAPALMAGSGQNANPQASNPPQDIVAKALSACLQRCANTATAFSNGSAWMNLNTGMNVLLAQNSGYRNFLAQIP